jgi:hypothetical protein
MENPQAVTGSSFDAVASHPLKDDNNRFGELA